MPLATAVILVVALVAPAAWSSDVAQPEVPTFVGEMGRGDALFWDGPYLERVGTARQGDTVTCLGPATTLHTCELGTLLLNPTGFAANFQTRALGEQNPLCGVEHACFEYAFEVTEPGDVLRVALDQPSLRDFMFVYVYDPSGTLAAATARTTAEAWIENPEVGRWVARVEVMDARDTSFRMRAALDPDERRSGRAAGRASEKKTGLLLPNLQVVPPYELGFGPCQTTEVVTYDAQRCLRFSTGPANVGDGPLDLVVRDTGSAEGQMYQRLHRSDGTTEVVPAGSFEYHSEHAHYHSEFLQSLELLRVVDSRRGLLEPAGRGPKIGFCLLPYHIVEWDSFAQDPPHSVYEDEACSGLAQPPIPTQMALARGWVDIYTWWTEGNFVDFGANPDGLYVIRAASDPNEDILETRDDDNVAYTFLRVTGDVIEVLERGLGDSPWDPHGDVSEDFRRPLRWEPGGSAGTGSRGAGADVDGGHLPAPDASAANARSRDA